MSDANEDEPEFASLCAQARDLAKSGYPKQAAQLYERVLEGGSEHHRARAALGLAVVRYDLDDRRAARWADGIAIETGHPEFAPRAAYHLALTHEEDGATDEAIEAWRTVLRFDNDRYTPAAHYGLARLAEERGESETALTHWERVLEFDEESVVPDAAYDLAGRLLERGEPATAADAVHRGLEIAEHPGLRVMLGAVYVERAIAEFGAVADAAHADPGGDSSVDPGAAGVAFEMLARLLALRGDPEQAEQAWEYGLSRTDARTAEEVRSRLRRGFLEPVDDPNEELGGARTAAWWEPYVEAAVAQDSSAMLTGELFAALSRVYTHLAAPLAANESRVAALRQAMADAVHTPSEYIWGPTLHEDFRERFRQAAGSDTHILPEGWPDPE